MFTSGFLLNDMCQLMCQQASSGRCPMRILRGTKNYIFSCRKGFRIYGFCRIGSPRIRMYPDIAEITAKTGKDPSALYEELAALFGHPVYERIDAPATPEQKAALKGLSLDMVNSEQLAGDPITDKLTRAPGNDEPIGGLKVASGFGWFAARPSGTEDIYKLYAESFKGQAHLEKIKEEAQAMVNAAFKAAGV